MRHLRIGQLRYVLSGSDGEIALAHALGRAFVELQQLEFTIIFYLSTLEDCELAMAESFDLFSSKTFGNLIRAMKKHDFLASLADDLSLTKERRDFFIHKFLFQRYGGDSLTRETEYELLVREAHHIGALFAGSRLKLVNCMLERAPIEMFAAKTDPISGEPIVVWSEFSAQSRVKSK